MRSVGLKHSEGMLPTIHTASIQLGSEATISEHVWVGVGWQCRRCGGGGGEVKVLCRANPTLNPATLRSMDLMNCSGWWCNRWKFHQFGSEDYHRKVYGLFTHELYGEGLRGRPFNGLDTFPWKYHLLGRWRYGQWTLVQWVERPKQCVSYTLGIC